MNEEMIALGRRAVACKGWRWMPGMAIGEMMLTSFNGLWCADHGRVLDMRDDDGMEMVSASEYPYDDDGTPEYRWADATHIPDLSDPATLGCLLALVREAFDSPGMCACMMQGPGEWMILLDTSNHVIGRTEAEALVAALEAAP